MNIIILTAIIGTIMFIINIINVFGRVMTIKNSYKKINHFVCFLLVCTSYSIIPSPYRCNKYSILYRSFYSLRILHQHDETFFWHFISDVDYSSCKVQFFFFLSRVTYEIKTNFLESLFKFYNIKRISNLLQLQYLYLI